MKTNPLTQDLYSIDWSKRFEEYENFHQLANKDLDGVLKNIEGIIKSTIDVKDIDDIERLKQRYKDTKNGSPEWRALAMLIDLKTLSAARARNMSHTATTCAMQIMGDLWQSLAEDREDKTTSVSQSNHSTIKKKNQKSSKHLPKLKLEEYTSKKRSNKQTNSAQENSKDQEQKPITENVVIKSLAAHAEKMEGKKAHETSKEDEALSAEDTSPVEDNRPMSVRCIEVATMLAEEYPHYTLTAIRVMAAEKLGVTRQYLENLDIKPKRFK